MKALTPFLITAALGAVLPAAAHQHAGHQLHRAAQTAEVPWTRGEVKKVDKEAGKVTIKHGPLVNLDMPAMTMVFGVKEAAMLEKVKVGDSIEFRADKDRGSFVVTELKRLS